MSVRGSKNKILIYIAGVCSVVFFTLLYQNASQRLEEMGKLYERCHLNEESLSAQLQGFDFETREVSATLSTRI